MRYESTETPKAHVIGKKHQAKVQKQMANRLLNQADSQHQQVQQEQEEHQQHLAPRPAPRWACVSEVTRTVRHKTRRKAKSS
mmetsp:Transcript_60117/g.107281  ORF Transcript_60117/g.107281 Transcript_60117/m.107281 type:complete len:82 (-) Transcript_60117:18-263(-)